MRWFTEEKIDFYCIMINATAATFSIVKNVQKLNRHLFHITKSTQCNNNTDKRSPFRLTAVVRTAILAWRTLTVKFHHLTGVYFMTPTWRAVCRMKHVFSVHFFFFFLILQPWWTHNRWHWKEKLKGNMLSQWHAFTYTHAHSHISDRSSRNVRITHNRGEGKYRLQR